MRISIEEKREYNRKYYQNNLDIIRERSLKYYKNNQEKVRKRINKYRKLNGDKVRDGRNKRYKDNKEEINETRRERYKDNKEEINETRRNSYNKNLNGCRVKHNARRAFCNTIKNGKTKRGYCFMCGKPATNGHHDDYSKPLEVIEFCSMLHHKEYERINGGQA